MNLGDEAKFNGVLVPNERYLYYTDMVKVAEFEKDWKEINTSTNWTDVGVALFVGVVTGFVAERARH